MDLIDRQAAIDSLKAHEDYKGYLHGDFETILEALPSAQPEIIRCKDCKHYEADIMGNPWGVCCHQDWVIGDCGSHVDEKGWCYRAERRTDE